MYDSEKHYQSRGNFVKLWKSKSNEFYESALLVWKGKVDKFQTSDGQIYEDHLLYRPAQLLMGMCLEVLLKGLLIEQNPELIDGARLPKKLSTHSLEKLFTSCSITLLDNEEELNFVRKLSDAVEWVSKYPIPLHAEHLKYPKHRSERTMTRNDKDLERFMRLREKVKSEFKVCPIEQAEIEKRLEQLRGK